MWDLKATTKRLFRGRLASLCVFVISALFLMATHAPLLRLPYFWDEAGYYIPAARDLLGGSLIPHSTPSNAHPPLVLAWLAPGWKLFGFHPAVTRVAMLLLAAFCVLGFFRLAMAVSNLHVAGWATLLTAIYPVFFAQSSLAQVDLPAAGLGFWGLEAYVRRRFGIAAAWFSLAALAKETAILVPLALVLYGLVILVWHRCGRWPALAIPEAAAFEISSRECQEHESQGESQEEGYSESEQKSATSGAEAETRGAHQIGTSGTRALPGSGELGLIQFSLCQFGVRSMLLLTPIIPLAIWYGYHFARTGFVFGNPEFLRYNALATLHPLRIFLALLLRLWQTLGYMNLYVLTIACVMAMQPPIHDSNGTRQRIAVPTQLAFLAIIAVNVTAMSVVGGAVLARYLLPVVPLVILICVSTVWRRLTLWKPVLGIVALSFIAGLFVNPPYGFAPEDNLAYCDYIRLHRDALHWLQARYPHAHVLTAWPASGELTHPYLGYVEKPMPVVQIEDFSAEQLLAAADVDSRFDIALVFSTKYETHSILDRWKKWQDWKSRYFGFHRDLPPEIAAGVLRGRLVYVERQRGQWVGIVEIQRVHEASLNAEIASVP